MYPLVAAVALSASLTTAYAAQHPLINQVPLAAATPKVLVSSASLEADITKANLLVRAKELYKVAELSLDEYNHPTRVIGSEGMLFPF
jgi:aminopeptidase Y